MGVERPVMDAAAYIRREAAIGFAINAGLSAAFFLLVFGRGGPVPVWGMAGLVGDCLPQGFMVGLMSSAIPGLLARRQRRSGRLAALSGTVRGPQGLLLRSLLFAALSAALLVLMATALAMATGGIAAGWWAALAMKVAAGGMLGAAVTAIGLRATLRQPL